MVYNQQDGICESWIEEPFIHLNNLTLFLGPSEVDICFQACRIVAGLITTPVLAGFVGHQLVTSPLIKLFIEVLTAYAITGAI